MFYMIRVHNGCMTIPLFHLYGKINPLTDVSDAYDRHNRHHLFQPNEWVVFFGFKNGQSALFFHVNPDFL